jgi:hypothetical protein
VHEQVALAAEDVDLDGHADPRTSPARWFAASFAPSHMSQARFRSSYAARASETTVGVRQGQVPPV